MSAPFTCAGCGPRPCASEACTDLRAEADEPPCGDCGRSHAGPMFAGICIGCPCTRTGPPWHRSPCRTSCPTGDHASWGDCIRAARIGVDRVSLRP